MDSDVIAHKYYLSVSQTYSFSFFTGGVYFTVKVNNCNK